MDVHLEEARQVAAVEPVRNVRVEVRLPTPPILELGFYTFALLTGVALGAVATLVAHLAA